MSLPSYENPQSPRRSGSLGGLSFFPSLALRADSAGSLCLADRRYDWDADFGDDNMVFLFSFSKASNVNPEAIMWIDNVRMYAGKFDEEDLGLQPKAVDARDRLAIRWASLRANS